MAFHRIQFIVSTHSPFIAQSARPGGLFVLQRLAAAGDTLIGLDVDARIEAWLRTQRDAA